MPRFRSKPSEIEAVQWFPGVDIPGLEHVPGTQGADSSIWPDYAVVQTLGGPATVHPGDWVITEPGGIHHYPCKPEVFEKRWEPIGDGR